MICSLFVCVGFRVWGLGFGVWGLGFGVWRLGFTVWGGGSGVPAPGCAGGAQRPGEGSEALATLAMGLTYGPRKKLTSSSYIGLGFRV